MHPPAQLTVDARPENEMEVVRNERPSPHRQECTGLFDRLSEPATVFDRVKDLSQCITTVLHVATGLTE